jgi:hypothetical protein
VNSTAPSATHDRAGTRSRTSGYAVAHARPGRKVSPSNAPVLSGLQRQSRRIPPKSFCRSTGLSRVAHPGGDLSRLHTKFARSPKAPGRDLGRISRRRQESEQERGSDADARIHGSGVGGGTRRQRTDRGCFASKVCRSPAVVVCALGAVIGITLGNVLVPSIDEALGIGDIALPAAAPIPSIPHIEPSPSHDMDGSTPTPAGQPHDGHVTASGPADSSEQITPSKPGAAASDSENETSQGDPATAVEPSASSTGGADARPPSRGKQTPPPATPAKPEATPLTQSPAKPQPLASSRPMQPADSPSPTPSPAPTPTPTSDDSEQCLEIDLSPLELALCLLEQSSYPTPPPGDLSTPQDTSTSSLMSIVSP